MDDITLQNIKELMKDLPFEVRSFVASSDWDNTLEAILVKINIPEANRGAFRNEVLLVLIGVTHPDAFRSALGEHVGGEPETLDLITTEVDEKIFASIRPALVSFYEAGATPAPEAPQEGVAPESVSPLGSAPENLPSEDADSFLPKLTPKAPQVETAETPALHPFEEKLRAASPVVSAPQEATPPIKTPDLGIPASTPPRTSGTDPYREPII